MKIVISGYGKMGRIVEQLLKEKDIPHICTEDIQSVAPEIAEESVCIDFTTPEAFMNNYRFLATHFKAVVVGTTGWNSIFEAVKTCFEQEKTPLIYASNFSIGVNVFFKLAEDLSKRMSAFPDYRAFIQETHHIHKLDKPSGTAKTIAQIVETQLKREIAVESVREGEVVGIHELDFENEVEKISIHHQSYSREGFAQGAIQAAFWTESLQGVWEFKDLIEKKIL